jgi:FkbM family methyltransferase
MRIRTIAYKISCKLKTNPALHRALRKVYCFFSPGILSTIEQTFKQHQEVIVVKVGANDGVTNDQLSDFMRQDVRFRGFLVEPIPMYASLLEKNYGHFGRFTSVRAAITEQDATCKVFYLNESGPLSSGQPVPSCYRGVASLSRRHVERHLPHSLHERIDIQTVDGLSVETLCKQYNIEAINIIHIDTEGADYDILKQFDFNKVHPEIVLYEHKHLGAREKAAARALMQKHGYHVNEFEVDSLCILRKA